MRGEVGLLIQLASQRGKGIGIRVPGTEPDGTLSGPPVCPDVSTLLWKDLGTVRPNGPYDLPLHGESCGVLNHLRDNG